MKLPGQVALCFALVCAFSVPATSQHHDGTAMPGPSADATTTPVSPYVGMERRAVKALSEQQIADLKTGRGMGLALAAELNGYPGPLHVLELADALQLTHEQRTRTKALFEAMKIETISIGEGILVEEVSLNRLFAEKVVTQALLDGAADRIGTAQGALRSAHLRYHLAMVNLLAPAQIAHYAKLRGYVPSGPHQHNSR